MYVKDKLWLPEHKLIEGQVCLELFDARSGKLQERVEVENYATDVLLSALKWAARYPFAKNNSAYSPANDAGNNFQYDNWTSSPNTSNNSDFAPSIPMPNGVFLTSASHAIDQPNDRFVRGAVTAWSYLDQYVGSSIFRGTVNTAEGSAQPTKVITVIDWPTNSGNGTINSVYWVGLTFPTSFAPFAAANPCFTGGNTGFGSFWTHDETGMSSGTSFYIHDYGLVLDADGVSYWTINQNSSSAWVLVKRTLGTGAIVTTVPAGASGAPMGIAFDGTNWWIFDSGGFLSKYSSTGTFINQWSYSTIGMANPSGTNGNSVPMFMDNSGHLWIGSAANMYQISLSGTPTVITSFAASLAGAGNNNCGCYYHDATNGDELWVFNGSYGYVFVYNLSGNLIRQFKPAGEGLSAPPNGLAISSAGVLIGSFGVNSGGPYGNVCEESSDRQFWARALLPTPVTKSNTQTMKLTYEFDYS